ncbi:hypothetical protein GTO27_11435 [Candidatus Bathyarchaeota archaeon]|nr:hypothetical protein [Candidatus Bathyarchaeota archaeon]
MKYIPLRFKELFNIRFLKRTWDYKGLKLFRAEKLYTAKNYQIFLKTFRDHFPEYVYFCHFREKEVISTPLDYIERVYVPRQCLSLLLEKEDRDSLQEKTVKLIELMSNQAGLHIEDFGVHGSIALDMHSLLSDIDLVVYGAESFRRLEKALDRLVREGVVEYVITNQLDAARHYRGRYEGKIFMHNAVRKPEETHSEYGTHKYIPIKPVKLRCRVTDDGQAMFRPAIYKIGNYKPRNSASTIPEGKIPRRVVSMIGCYRNIARRGDDVGVSGMLEQVENIETGKIFHQVVVGTGMNEDEHVWPI